MDKTLQGDNAPIMNAAYQELVMDIIDGPVLHGERKTQTQWRLAQDWIALPFPHSPSVLCSAQLADTSSKGR